MNEECITFLIEDRYTGTMLQGKGKHAKEIKHTGYTFASLSDVISRFLDTGKIKTILLKTKDKIIEIKKEKETVITCIKKCKND